MKMEMEMPWTWRATRHARHSIPWKGDMRKYRSGIQELLKMVRTADTNRCCADCGIPHHPVGQMDMSTPSTNGVAYANPWLGVFICHDCAKCHEELLPSPLNQGVLIKDTALTTVLYSVYDLHKWSLDDVAQMARWGNLRVQRYWLGKYRVEIDGWSEIIKPNRSAMTRKQWILKKYVEREWVLECLPQNPEILCSINLYEQRCFKQLKIMGWVPPVSKSSSPQRTPKGRGDNEINLERSPKNLTAAVVTPIKAGSYEDVLVISSQPREETTETRVRVAKNIFATKSSGQSLPEPISVAPPSRKQISDSKPGKPANLSLTPYTSFNPTVKPAPKIVKPNLAARPQSPTSEFSDDLYGTGRPLRPGLINPTSVIHEWLISSTGNPPLSVSATAPWEEHPDLPPPIIKPNRLHEWSLIPIEGEDLPVGSGETITEEDSSILAELNEAFIHQGDEEREAVRMEDDLTEVGSEVEKIVFQFEWSKGPIPKGAKEFEGEESDEDVGSFEIEDLEGGVDDCLSECTGNVSDAEVILETDVIWEVCAEGKASKKEFQEREKRFEEAPPTSHEIPRELSSKTESIPENTEPQEFQEEPQSLSSQVHEPSIDIETGSNTELKQSIPSSFVEEHISETQSTTRSDPFATVLSNLKLSKNKVCDIAESPYLEHAGKQDLRLFLLKSGLFSKQVF